MIRTIGLLGFLLWVGPSPAAGVPLEAGVARVEITPAAMMPMYGYSNRKCGPAATGTHDPLFAKALVLKAGETRMAIVTMDIGNLVSDRLRRQVAEQLGIPVLLLAASHTHSGPQFLSYSTKGPTPEGSAYLEELERRIFAVLKEASANLFPARLSVARGSLQLGYNRLLMREDGRARALFDNMERIPYGPVDPEMVLLRVEEAAGGTPRALLVHYACHAVVLGPSNCKYSADWPGVMQAKVEASLPGLQCMFVQGGAGDVNPLFMARSGNEEQDFAVVRKMGETMAAKVLETVKTAQPCAREGEGIRTKSEVLTFQQRWEKDKPIEAGITTVLINRDIAIAAVPGEPHHKLQTMWKAQADVPVPLFYGYTYSAGSNWPGYIPDLRSAAYGGYGADTATRIEVGAGERIMERHLINLYGLRGMWLDKPGKN